MFQNSLILAAKLIIMRLLRSVLILLLIAVTTLSQAQMSKDSGYIVHIGDTVPDIELLLINGERISLADLRGKVVVLQFTASWCSVCRKEMPHLEKEVWQQYKDDDFILIGVDYDEPLETVVAFKEKMNTTYPMALDPGAAIFSKFALKRSGVTRNVVIDREGRIAFLTRLYDRDEFESMKNKIHQLLQ